MHAVFSTGPVRGPWNLGVVTGIVPPGLLAEKGIFALVSEHSV